jgi:hypothetical protein
LFFDDHWMRDRKFSNVLRRLLEIDGGANYCVVNLDELASGTKAEDCAVSFDATSTEEEYWTALSPWIPNMSTLGCAGDSFRWCIFCEPIAEMAIIAFRDLAVAERFHSIELTTELPEFPAELRSLFGVVEDDPSTFASQPGRSGEARQIVTPRAFGALGRWFGRILTRRAVATLEREKARSKAAPREVSFMARPIREAIALPLTWTFANMRAEFRERLLQVYDESKRSPEN